MISDDCSFNHSELTDEGLKALITFVKVNGTAQHIWSVQKGQHEKVLRFVLRLILNRYGYPAIKVISKSVYWLQSFQCFYTIQLTKTCLNDFL